MTLASRIDSHFEESLAVKTAARALLVEPAASAARLLVRRLDAGGKLLLCGNGGSAADCQHMAAELIGRFERERVELAAIALTTDSSILSAVANDYHYDQVFARQVRALGATGDVLIAISTSGNSESIVAAARAAQSRGMYILALTGRDGGQLASVLGARDIELRVPHSRTARIQEVHELLIHCLCDAIDALRDGDPV